MSGYLMLADGTDIREFYVAVPTQDGGVVHVREDYFDRFSDEQYEYIMDQLDGVDGIHGIWSNMRKKQKDRREERRTKREAEDEKQGMERQNKRDAKEAKKQGRQTRRKNFFDQVTDTVRSITGGGGGEKSVDVTGSVTASTGNDDNNGSKETKFYEDPVFIVGGIILLGVGAYLVMNRKK